MGETHSRLSRAHSVQSPRGSWGEGHRGREVGALGADLVQGQEASLAHFACSMGQRWGRALH